MKNTYCLNPIHLKKMKYCHVVKNDSWKYYRKSMYHYVEATETEVLFRRDVLFCRDDVLFCRVPWPLSSPFLAWATWWALSTCLSYTLCMHSSTSGLIWVSLCSNVFWFMSTTTSTSTVLGECCSSLDRVLYL